MNKPDFYTGYYAMSKHYPPGILQVAISRILPEFWGKGEYSHLYDPNLAPTMDILKNTRSKEEYEKRYREEVLEKLKPEFVHWIHKGKMFLCYEAPGKFCHRHILADWLREAGYTVEEFPVFIKTRRKIIPGQLDLFQEVG